MATGVPTDPKIKQEILDKINNEGLSAYKASQIYNLNTKTIYSWLKKDVKGQGKNLALENAKLKKELDMAYRIIGRMTAEISRPKD